MSIKTLEKKEIFNGYSDCLKEIGVFLMSRIELERYFDFLSLKKSNVFCFYKEKNIAGSITLDIYQKKDKPMPCAYISNLCVQKKFSGYGIASSLLDYCYSFAKENNCYELSLNCDANMIDFYKKNGFLLNGTCMRKKIDA